MNSVECKENDDDNRDDNNSVIRYNSWVVKNTRRRRGRRSVSAFTITDNNKNATTKDNLVQLKNKIIINNKEVQSMTNEFNNIYDSFVERINYIDKQNIVYISNNLNNKYMSYVRMSNEKEKQDIQSLSNDFSNIYDRFAKRINDIDNRNRKNNIPITNSNIEANDYNTIKSPMEDNKDEDASVVRSESNECNVLINTGDVTNDVVNICDDIFMNDCSCSSASVNDDICEINKSFGKKHRGGYDTYGWMYFVRYVFGVKSFVKKKRAFVRAILFKVVTQLPPRLTYLGYDFGEDFIG